MEVYTSITISGFFNPVNLFPFLFSLYSNDLEGYLLDNNLTGLSIITEEIEKKLFMVLKMSILFYAGNTVILAESENDLQFAMRASTEIHVRSDKENKKI